MKLLSRVPRRLAVLVAIAATSAVAYVTEPFARTNPFDPEAPLQAQIVGVPDSMFSRGDTFRVSLVTDPVLPEGAVIRWYGDAIQSLGGGLFRARDATHYPLRATVIAEIGPTRVPRRLSTSVLLKQRVYSVTTECDTGCLYRWLEIYDTVLTTPRDSLDSLVYGYLPTLDVTVISRDTNVATVPATRTSNYWTVVRPRANGQTWIVMSFGNREKLVSDSFPVTVQQLLWYMPNNCPLTMLPSEGDTVRQIVTTPPGTDFNGIPYSGVMPSLQWVATGSSGNDIQFTVSPSGLVQYVSGDGFGFFELQAEGGRTISRCTIHVPWPASVSTAPTP
jgi:hypothetical protein